MWTDVDPLLPGWRPSWLAPGEGTGSVAEAGGGAARHTRAWLVDAPAVVADCRRLKVQAGRSEGAEGQSSAAELGRPWAVQGRSTVANDDQRRPPGARVHRS